MRKIKSNYKTYFHDLINDKIHNKDNQFLKLDSEINEKLTKKYNVDLMNIKFKDLYENSKIMSKYKHKNENHNKEIIQKIYNDENEAEVNEILEMTYKDVYNNYFIKYNLDNFLNNVVEEERNKNESEERILDYKADLKFLCLNYENWFLGKKPRNRKKNKDAY